MLFNGLFITLKNSNKIIIAYLVEFFDFVFCGLLTIIDKQKGGRIIYAV